MTTTEKKLDPPGKVDFDHHEFEMYGPRIVLQMTDVNGHVGLYSFDENQCRRIAYLFEQGAHKLAGRVISQDDAGYVITSDDEGSQK